MRNLTKILIPFLLFSLVLVGYFTPLSVNAGFLSTLLGTEASAEDSGLFSSNKNSQTMTLLQANVSSASIFQEKKNKDSNKQEEVSIEDDANVNIVSDNALMPSITAAGNILGIGIGSSSSDQISIYVVRKGDSIKAIADMFDVSVNTILIANDMKKGDKLVEGMTLIILPVSGSEHTVVKGQTLKSIAKLYKVDVTDITAYNGISEDDKLSIGDKIFILGGDTMSDEGGDKPAPNLKASLAKDKNYYENNPIKNLFGFFLNPVPTGRKTQGLHGPGHRGIDIGAPTGTPMYASASGTVIFTKIGCVVGRKSCGGGYGNMVIIEHSNNTKTLYAHMSKVATKRGETVAGGDFIGSVGNTGKSTGPHIHFEVFNAKNPGVDWSWAN